MDTQTASMTYISGMKRGASDSGIDRLVPLPAKAVKILTSSSNFADRYSSAYGIGDLSRYPYVDYIREEEYPPPEQPLWMNVEPMNDRWPSPWAFRMKTPRKPRSSPQWSSKEALTVLEILTACFTRYNPKSSEEDVRSSTKALHALLDKGTVLEEPKHYNSKFRKAIFSICADHMANTVVYKLRNTSIDDETKNRRCFTPIRIRNWYGRLKNAWEAFNYERDLRSPRIYVRMTMEVFNKASICIDAEDLYNSVVAAPISGSIKVSAPPSQAPPASHWPSSRAEAAPIPGSIKVSPPPSQAPPTSHWPSSRAEAAPISGSIKVSPPPSQAPPTSHWPSSRAEAMPISGSIKVSPHPSQAPPTSHWPSSRAEAMPAPSSQATSPASVQTLTLEERAEICVPSVKPENWSLKNRQTNIKTLIAELAEFVTARRCRDVAPLAATPSK